MSQATNNTKRGFNLLLAGLAISVPLLLTGCNTVEGAGQDIQHGGQAIESAADSNK